MALNCQFGSISSGTRSTRHVSVQGEGQTGCHNQKKVNLLCVSDGSLAPIATYVYAPHSTSPIPCSRRQCNSVHIILYVCIVHTYTFIFLFFLLYINGVRYRSNPLIHLTVYYTLYNPSLIPKYRPLKISNP